MTSLVQQFGIDNLPTLRVLETIDQISVGLHGYDDNGPVRVSIRPNPNPKSDERGRRIIPGDRATLRTLADHKVIIYEYTRTKLITDGSKNSLVCNVHVIDRYKFEQLVVELDQRHSNHFTKLGHSLVVDDLIYYDIKTGEILINGLHKTLGKRNKELFDELFAASPNYAPRKRISTIARKYTKSPSAYTVSEAFTNLRKVCGVNAQIIELDSTGGRLNAFVYPLELQFPSANFSTE